MTSTPDATLAPGGSTTFIVRCAPGAAGLREADLHISSNDADENPFDIHVTATGASMVAAFDAWLPTSLPDRTPAGTPHRDGVSNLVKYAFNMNPYAPDGHVMKPGGNSGLPLILVQQIGGTTYLRFEFVRR